MSELVCMGALLRCSFGVAPSSLVVPPAHRVLTGTPAANIMDNKPMVNILPFAMCQSIANPTVAAATAAAMGALTPMPCIPNTPAPWVPGSPTLLLDGMPALDKSSKLCCLWAGVIEVTYAGQVTATVG